MRFLLASKSPARRATLISAGITPIVRVSDVDEDLVLADFCARSAGTPSPGDQVTTLADAKCDAVISGLVDGTITIDEAHCERLLVVACDSMLLQDGQMLGKPHTAEVARERIRAFRGSEALLWTGHSAALVERDPSTPLGSYALIARTHASTSTIVRFGSMSDAEIDAYVDSGEPLHVAGSFTIDGLGGPFIAGVDGDHHNVVGISLPLVHTMAEEVGVFWPDLWDHRQPR